MNWSLKYSKTLVLRLLLMLGIYILCRLVFFLLNYSFFNDAGPLAFLGGIRFDISAILLLNLPILGLSLIPFPFRDHKVYQAILGWMFILVNIPGIVFNCIDMEYFKFTYKRSTADLFDLMFLGQDLENLLPVFLRDFWYIVLICLVFVLILYFLDPGRKRSPSAVSFQSLDLSYFLRHTAILLIWAGITTIGIRGGFQYKPITILTAGKYASSMNTPLVLNTPFTIMKTLGEKSLNPEKLMGKEEAKKIFNPRKEFDNPDGRMKGKNIVIIILESISSGFSGALSGRKTYMPFLDSLISESLVFKNSYANGKKSIEAIPAITASIPSLMSEPFITSSYSANNFQSLASTLGKGGYGCTFYHGSFNGTMGFESFTKKAGFDDYFGYDQYDGPKNDVGAWGVRDIPYLQYFATELNKSSEPFFSTFFALSSHHPYQVPSKYKGSFKKGDLPILPTVQYTDLALRKFFDKASRMDWFDHTLFVITADHNSKAGIPFYDHSVGMYRVPLLFYDPSGTLDQGMVSKVAQQTDIMPSILDLTGYQKPFIAFGKSLFREVPPRYNITHRNEVYQAIGERYAIRSNPWQKGPISLHDLQKDPLLQDNIVSEQDQVTDSVATYLNAFVQQYNTRMIHNRLLPK